MVQDVNSYEALVAQIDEIGPEAVAKKYRKPPLPTRILRSLYELYPEDATYVSFLAQYPLIPSDLADQIASELDLEKTEIAIHLASNPRSPQQSLSRLVTHPSTAVRHALAANPNLTPKEFNLLIEDSSPFIRAELAKNPSLPNPLQFLLAADQSPAVQIALSSRKNLDVDIAVHLTKSDDPLVRAAVILNYNLDEELLQLWADGSDSQNQELLLKRTRPVPDSVKQALRFSDNSHVAREALNATELSGPEMRFLSQSDDPRNRSFLAEQPNLPSSIQRLLAQDSSPKVRRRLAANHTIDASIALHIVASNDLGACRKLAQNPALTPEVIEALCKHSEDEIALLIAYREDLTEAHLSLLLNHRDTHTVAEHIAYQGQSNATLEETVAESLAHSEVPTLRAFSAKADTLSSKTLSTLIVDPSLEVRRIAATNDRLNAAQLEVLYSDLDRTVIFNAEDTRARQIRVKDPVQPSRLRPPEPPAERTESGILFNKIKDFFKE